MAHRVLGYVSPGPGFSFPAPCIRDVLCTMGHQRAAALVNITGLIIKEGPRSGDIRRNLRIHLREPLLHLPIIGHLTPTGCQRLILLADRPAYFLSMPTLPRGDIGGIATGGTGLAKSVAPIIAPFPHLVGCFGFRTGLKSGLRMGHPRCGQCRQDCDSSVFQSNFAHPRPTAPKGRRLGGHHGGLISDDKRRLGGAKIMLRCDPLMAVLQALDLVGRDFACI
jgi:hypothetical protein